MRNMLTCLLLVLGLTCSCSHKDTKDIGVDEFAELIGDSCVVLLDVRTDSEYAEEHIAGAINVDFHDNQFVELAKAAIKNQTATCPADSAKHAVIAVYCRSGRRSAAAADLLSQEGYDTRNLKGGIVAWKEANRPVTEASAPADSLATDSVTLSE